MGKLQGQSAFFRPGPPAVPGQGHKPLIDFLRREVQGTTVVDLGGGEGAYSLELKANGFDMTVADINASSLAVAEKNGLRTVNLSGGKVLPEKSADTVMLVEVLEHVDDPKEFLKMAISVARRRVVFTLPCTNDFDELFGLGLSYAHIAVSDHLWHFSYEEMKAILDSLGVRYRLEMGDYLFPHMSMHLLRQSLGGPLGFLAMLPVRIANRLGMIKKRIPSRFYGVIEVL